MTATPYADRMRAKLTEALAPTDLVIEDQSDRHAGHGGWKEEGETHFHIIARSAVFDGLNRVQRQRLVMKTVASELEERVHALSMDLKGAAD